VLPTQALDLCEHWLERNREAAADMSTAAAADTYYVINIVLAAHAQTAAGSTGRDRSLHLIGELIEAGTADRQEVTA
jgi:hypothetical protein